MFKILVINDSFPHINNRTTIFFNNIIPHLSKIIEVKVYWLITDGYGQKHNVIFPQYEYLFMSDFKNAMEACKKIKPEDDDENSTELPIGILGRSTSLYYSKILRGIIIPQLAHPIIKYLQSENFAIKNEEWILDGLTNEEKAQKILFMTRPTAVNLVWGLEQIMKVAKENDSVDEIKESIIDKAKQMADDDIKINKEMGKHGSQLFENNDSVMTHCNAGALATVGYGTALGVIRATKESGKNIKVIATETRPVQQGSRLTAFELKHDGIDVTIIPDTAVGYTMANNLVNRVVVGADRILRTGHVYNKIGTYQVATMAKQHNIPFYVAAPLSTFDLKSNTEDVIIEQRNASEVTGIGDKKTAPDDIGVINPAFDLTTPDLISGIITEKGVIKPPYEESISKLFEAN